VTIVNTKKEVIQLRMEGSKTEDEAKIPFATIVLIPHALGYVSSLGEGMQLGNVPIVPRRTRSLR
jgi:hypothetical protein